MAIPGLVLPRRMTVFREFLSNALVITWNCLRFGIVQRKSCLELRVRMLKLNLIAAAAPTRCLFVVLPLILTATVEVLSSACSVAAPFEVQLL